MNVPEAANLLGVPVGATEVEVRRAYRAIIRARHPDRAGTGSTAEAARVIEAYGVLRSAGRLATRATPPGGAPVTGDRPPAAAERPADRPPTRRWEAPPPGGPGTVVVRVDDDTIGFAAPADETLLLLLEAAHDLGELTYLDRSMPIIEVICQFEGTPTLSLVITLQGRCDGTEAFCTVESIEAASGPPAAAVVDVLFHLLHQRPGVVGR